jgi:transposase-like protein
LIKKYTVIYKRRLNSEFLKQFKDSGELDGFLSELHKRGIEKMLEGELDSHLGYERYSPEGKNTGNSRNGKTEKKIKTGFGESQIEVPRDRDGSFEPAIVPKRKGLAKGIEDLVISLYAKGMGNSDIEEQIREIYDFRLSTSTISNITSKIHQDILEWQSRPLDPVYLIVWMDGIVFKVRQSGKVINKTIYLAVGLNRDGKKEVLGMWLGETESASFWSGVLSDLQSRGLEDILITSTDNLKGFTDAIRSIFTGAVTQICVVHQTRNAIPLLRGVEGPRNRRLLWIKRAPFTVTKTRILGSSTEIDQSRTKAKSPQTNGICERFHRTHFQDEFYPVAFTKDHLYDQYQMSSIQKDLDLWMDHYNQEQDLFP